MSTRSLRHDHRAHVRFGVYLTEAEMRLLIVAIRSSHPDSDPHAQALVKRLAREPERAEDAWTDL